ncbi:MAG: ABC transporter substrate-binding protein [Oscillospiraceae bacterium]|nr:ABC transporter substrate-binding protein [Oscillospiraceae bacterium]
MKKRILAGVLSAATVLTLTTGLTGCKDNGAGHIDPVFTDDGKKLRIACWNWEFAEYFDAFYASKLPEGITVEWAQFPNEGKNYQDNLDRLLKANIDAPADEKIDIFLAEADYIKKYVNSDYSLDVKSLGVTDTTNAYKYVLDAATTDSGNVLKGVSFQACPGAVIIRKSIAKDVLGTDDPNELQSKLDSWDKFNAVAADAKAKGYMMTPSVLETYRAFANNATTSYLNDNKFAPTEAFNNWFAQSKEFVSKGYTQVCDLWDPPKDNQMLADGKAMCFFGPSWYYNFSMGTAQKNTNGDWCVIQGPQAYFWGGTWLLAANGTDNSSLVKQIMNDFMNDTELMEKLVKGTGIKEWKDGKPTSADHYNPCFANNKAIIKKYVEDASYGNSFLGGQNDLAVMTSVADNIVWKKELHTIYDQTFNETLPKTMLDFFSGNASEEAAWNKFYNELATVDSKITH